MKLTRRLLVVRATFLLPLLLQLATFSGAGAVLTNGVVHDDRMEETLRQAGVKLMAGKDFASMKKLAGQLKRPRCALTLSVVTNAESELPDTVERVRLGVLVVASLYQCRDCREWHVASAAGFMLTASGAFATCYHVVDHPEHAVMVVMTGDGRVCGVREVLAANEAHDVAILQLDGSGFTPLALETDARVGSRVFVLGHPEDHYFTLTEGIVSRYFTGQKETGDAVMMGITADFGRGSSGCPVFNLRGEVVALADNIVSSDSKTGAKLIFKHARPVRAVLDLIQPGNE